MDEIRIGISACLIGERVRWNGEHKRAPSLVDTVGRFVKFVPACPEMELGLGTPRPRALRRGAAGLRLAALAHPATSRRKERMLRNHV